MTLVEILIYIVIALLFIAVPFLMSINLEVEERHRQHLIVVSCPIILTVLCFIASYAVHIFDDAPWEWMRYVFQSHLALLAWNLIVVYAYLLIRGSLLRFVKTMALQTRYSDIDLPKFWAWIRLLIRRNTEKWYEYDEDLKVWLLKDRYVDLRKSVYFIERFVFLTMVALLAYGVMHTQKDGYIQRIYPLCIFIVISELNSFLGGLTRSDYDHVYGGKGISAQLYGNYSKLRAVLEETFAEENLVSRTNNEFNSRPGSMNFLNDLEASADPVDRIVSDYYRSLPDDPDGSFDVDLVHLTQTLLHGNSAVLMNPFYRDIGKYILLPMVNELVNNRKIMVIIGRNSMAEDVIVWLKEILKDYCHTEQLWRVMELDEHTPDCEVGILAFSRLYDREVLKANRDFIANTDFVLMFEPSHMLTTSQIGLANLADILRENGSISYCICDRDTDGLVDTLSHVLKVNLTDVVSGAVPQAVYTVMGWDADGDFQRQKLFGKEVHYLGDGIELASVAMKNQIPFVSWFAESKAPIRDIRWIAGQYYPQICRYAGLPSIQTSMDDYIEFSSNLWSAERQENAFIIAEDEFCNLFAAARLYMTRGENQAFVNVLSENYLMRDYMRMNRQMFMTDHKAIPMITSSYVKSERNTVHRLILMMAAEEVSEEFIRHELSLLDIDPVNLYDTLTDLIRKYTVNIKDAIITVRQKIELDQNLISSRVNYYTIDRRIFDRYFRETLRNAYFVVEDEIEGTEVIDSRLYEHVTQLVMPGQLIIDCGKLYRVHSVNPDGCILHRAADAYSGRRYYRQKREYTFDEGFTTERIRRISDLEIATECRAFHVETTGYLDMKNNGDLRTARFVDLSDDPQIGAFRREFKNKNVLRLKFSGLELNQGYTLTVLLSELFRSLFPDSWQYISVLHDKPEDIEGVLEKFTYGIHGSYDPESIYIVEDSDMDIGLLETVDHNINRILEMIADYVDWHFETLHQKEENPRNNTVTVVVLPPDQKVDKPKKKSLLERIRDWFRGLGKKKNNEVVLQPMKSSAMMNADEAGAKPQDDTQPADPSAGNEQPQEAPAEPEHPEEYIPDTKENGIPDSDIDVAGGAPDDIELEIPIVNNEYLRTCFLRLGFDEIDSRFDLEGLQEYMNKHGWCDNDLTRSRKRDSDDLPKSNIEAVAVCDFCQKRLTGVSFERLQDGRIRCNECSRTSIRSVEEFRTLAERTEAMMGNVFNVSFKKPIDITTADAVTLGRMSGCIFRPSGDFAARVLGYAQKKGTKLSIVIENGSPRLASLETFAHEMTHIWQYLNWDETEMVKRYGNQKNRLIVYEGMAVWASIQLMYAIGETEYARQKEWQFANRDDEYGDGFRLYCEKYGLIRNGDAPLHTPFNTFPPL